LGPLAIAARDLFAEDLLASGFLKRSKLQMRSGVAMVASTASQLQISWRATFTWMMPI
jgi:hypothetical protein